MIILYFILVICILISALFVVNTSNPIHSVFFLISCFLLSSLFLFLMFNEFIAIMFIIIYIGAIAVLFLFVIMMLDIKLIELQASSINYIPLMSLILSLFIFEMIYILKFTSFFVSLSSPSYIFWINYYCFNLTNIHIMGLYLYTYYAPVLIACAFLLFIATIGAILLTDVVRKNKKEYDVLKFEIISIPYFVEYKSTLLLVE